MKNIYEKIELQHKTSLNLGLCQAQSCLTSFLAFDFMTWNKRTRYKLYGSSENFVRNLTEKMLLSI